MVHRLPITRLAVRPASSWVGHPFLKKYRLRITSWSSNSRFIYAAVGDGDADVVLIDGLAP
jgi:hypothetical protein